MKEIAIDSKNEGRKLFRFIKLILPGLKNNDIFKIIRKKIIVVNDKKQETDYILKLNDIVKVFLKEDYFKKKTEKKFHSINSHLDIIFEDNDLIVVNKPRGLEAHGSINNYKENLQEAVKAYLYKKGEYDTKDYFVPTPCHRLDRNTTGVMVVAKNHLTLKKINTFFKERKTEKIYIALVSGRIEKKLLITSKIEINGNIVKSNRIKNLEKIPDKDEFLQKNPEMSASLIYPQKISNECSLVNIDLWTGKKHQIRAHLAGYGHPLLGDTKYFTNSSKKASGELGVTEYFLHAYKLKVEGYEEWTAELPEKFKNLIPGLFN